MVDFYKNYTSTQALSGADEAVQLRVAEDNLRYNILPHLPQNRNAHILDVPCGYGRYLKALASHGYTNASGIDISAEQIAFAREKLKLTKVEVADGLTRFRQAHQS